ncbi:MAG: F0F1 ATP synthase subunit B [Candidatus Saccharimonas sp.]
MLFAQFASAEATASSDPITALGINTSLLTFQIIGFALLVFALRKWVFPVFIRTIDKRQELIEESTRAAVDAEKNAAKTQAKIEAMLTQARNEAREIVATAKEEASGMMTDAEAKSKQQAEHIVASAQEEIAKEVLAAKKALHNETIELVALATEKVVGNAMNAQIDNTVIANALKAAK